AAVPADLRQTFARDIVTEGISASYPYASLSIGPLAQAAGIPYIRRKLVYVPSDPRLLRFRSDFSELPAILEEREPTGVKKTDNTEEVVLKLFKDNDDHIDQSSVLRARLLDNFIMDFDRHEDQWRWATYDTGKGKMYYAIPRDHDQAFFVSEGIIPRFAAKPWFVPEIQGFKPKARNIKTFNRPARNFDRFFMTELDEKDWQQHIDTFLNAMSDEVITKALQQQPKEIQGHDMDEIIGKLKKRRNYFRDEMLQYYRFISRTVNVTGSNQREQFRVIRNTDGSVQVIVNKIDKDSLISSQIYERTFDPAVTKEVHLYGLGDEDRFIIEGNRSPIKVRIIGGQGNDAFINDGTGGNVLVYDAAFEKNTISGNPGLNNEISNDPNVNTYNRLGFKYNFINPGVSVAYNIDDGVFLGGQLEIIRRGFRKEPYGSRQYFSGIRAFNTGALRFRYEGDWTKAFGNHDLIARADIRAPVNVTNFFGLGNKTTFDKSRQRRDLYYRARYDFIDASLLLRRQLQSWFRLNYGAAFQYYQVEREGNEGKYLSQHTTNGLDPETLYRQRMFAGAHFKLDINSRNNQVLPTRGFVLDLNARPLAGLNDYSHNLLRTDLDMRVYASLFSFPRIVLASRFGWGKNFGKFEFPQAYYLSGTENLRGYRRDRFAGRTRMFNNTELRFKIADFNTYLFPGSIGVLVFNDVGRVWVDGEKSRDWKVGNGIGIWVAPIRRFVIAAHLARSKEEKALPYVSFGFQF
ncbi:MAG TPA: BamA/TamA family outer membrane protein, partial [Flavisolibacter sp.]|nr:BamA/TamA family outer membrane protein [Flavisolibacter sp.]